MKSRKIPFIILFCLIICIISLTFNFYSYSKCQETNQEISNIRKNTSEIYNYLNSITVSNFNKKVASGEEFYVYVGRPDCMDCTLFEPIFANIIKEYKLHDKILYMNVKDFKENNEDKWQEFKDTYGFTQTPSLMYFNNGNNMRMIEWDKEDGLSKQRLITWLQNNKVIQ